MLLIKYENDVVPHSSICPASGMTAGDVTVWYQSLVSTLSLDGPISGLWTEVLRRNCVWRTNFRPQNVSECQRTT
jgi:hypothetical protein